MLRKNLKPLYLAGVLDLCVLAMPAFAQTSATQQLVNQGNYWHDQGRDDLAGETWRKLLAIDPKQPDALAGLGQIAVAQGRSAEARQYLQQLEAAHPGSPQARRLRQLIGGGADDSSNLRNARRASSAGRYAEAVRDYQKAFGGKAPPADLALEYYQAMAGTSNGWADARAGLEKLHKAQPGDTAVSLALAQALTYREPSRREGIAQLQELSKRADVGGPARRSWRQALLWLNASKADEPLYRAYLAASPGDNEVANKLAKVQKGVTGQDPNGPRLAEGFKALNAGNLAVAELRFTEVLRAHPHDAEALGGLGSVRLRQQRFSEAQELLRPAAESSAKWRGAFNQSRYWLALQKAAEASGKGDLAQASQLVQQAIAIDPKQPAGLVALGELQAATDAKAAEDTYRKALALDPDNAGALQGLVGLYSRQGRLQEATVLFNRLTPAQRAKAGGEASLRSNVQRAKARQALESGDTLTAQNELEKAMVERPGDPWVRLDLARLYLQVGRPDQARSVMDGLLAAHADDPTALYANALYAQETNDWSSAYDSLERIPQNRRTPEMVQLRNVAWVELQARQAVLLSQQGRKLEAQALLARTETSLGDQVDSPQLLASLAGAWADIGNAPRAMTLAQRLVSGNPSIDARMQYADVLLRAHQDAELAAVLRQLHGMTMTPAQLRHYQSLRTGYVLRQVDALRQLGNLEGAYDALSPILAQQPQNRDALGALARLYTSAGDQAQALAIYQQILGSHPNDLDTLVAAANAAAAQSDLDSAETYLQRALTQAPDSPDVLAAAGRVYRSAGKKRKAEQYFRAALAAQQRQAGQLDNGLPTAQGRASTGYASAARPFNPFAGMTGRMPRSSAVMTDSLVPAQPVGGAMMASAAPVLPATATPAARSGYGGYTAAPAQAQATVAASGDDLPPPVSAQATSASMALPIPGRRVSTASPRYVTGNSSYAATTGSPVMQQSSGDLSSAPLPPATTGNSVLDELRDLQSENSDVLAGGASYRSRDGESGLGQLDDIEMPLQGKFQVGNGELEVQVTPTVVDAGDVSTDYNTASRFGGGPSAALSDALAADSSSIDDLVGSDIYQLLLSDGNTTSTQNLLYDYAVSTGLYNTLYNDTDTTLTTSERESAALEELYDEPLYAYLLSIDASSTTIGDIATAILNSSSMLSDLSSSDIASLKLLASSDSASGMTASELSNTLYGMAANGAASRRLGQSDTGVGLAFKYRNGGFRADIGSTPLGFQEQNIIGGVGYQGQPNDTLTWNAEASRRPVTDSVLSFAGTTDARNDRKWGGVTSNGGSVSGTLDNGLMGAYANLAAHRITGHNVASNSQSQQDVGVYVHALDTENQSLTAGINLTAMQYDKNLSGYTYGQGGYFSPQEYFDLGFPVHWAGRSEGRKVNWKVDASVGVQHFSTDTTDYFPTDASLQADAYTAASLAAALGLVDDYTAPVYEGESKTGVSYNLTGSAEWQLAPQLFLGGRMTFNNARDYNQMNANVYLRFVLDRLGAALGREPQVLGSPYVDPN